MCEDLSERRKEHLTVFRHNLARLWLSYCALHCLCPWWLQHKDSCSPQRNYIHIKKHSYRCIEIEIQPTLQQKMCFILVGIFLIVYNLRFSEPWYTCKDDLFLLWSMNWIEKKVNLIKGKAVFPHNSVYGLKIWRGSTIGCFWVWVHPRIQLCLHEWIEG